MLKIRYNIKNRLLSGWGDNEAEFDQLQARKGEKTVILNIAKPDADDYEYFIHQDSKLLPSGKLPTKLSRDLTAEIDELTARIEKLET